MILAMGGVAQLGVGGRGRRNEGGRREHRNFSLGLHCQAKKSLAKKIKTASLDLYRRHNIVKEVVDLV